MWTYFAYFKSYTLQKLGKWQLFILPFAQDNLKKTKAFNHLLTFISYFWVENSFLRIYPNPLSSGYVGLTRLPTKPPFSVRPLPTFILLLRGRSVCVIVVVCHFSTVTLGSRHCFLVSVAIISFRRASLPRCCQEFCLQRSPLVSAYVLSIGCLKKK